MAIAVAIPLATTSLIVSLTSPIKSPAGCQRKSLNSREGGTGGTEEPGESEEAKEAEGGEGSVLLKYGPERHMI